MKIQFELGCGPKMLSVADLARWNGSVSLPGRLVSASSSYIAPLHFASDALIGLDLLAMRPLQPRVQKVLREYDPPKVPLRYLIYESFCFFIRGHKLRSPTLTDQVEAIIQCISGSLDDVELSWDQVIRADFYLHQSETIEDLKKEITRLVKANIPNIAFIPVDGYSTDGALLEIEVTALASIRGGK